MHSIQTKIQKIIIARCEPGDDLYVSLDQLVQENDVRSGFFQVIGAVSRARLGVFEHGKYEWMEHEGSLEISSCTGNISIKDGRSLVHGHAVLTDHKGTVLGGHVVEGCIVDPTAEIHLHVLEGSVERRLDKKTGLWLLDI